VRIIFEQHVPSAAIRISFPTAAAAAERMNQSRVERLIVSESIGGRPLFSQGKRHYPQRLITYIDNNLSHYTALMRSIAVRADRDRTASAAGSHPFRAARC
jgi:hypothetical protein